MPSPILIVGAGPTGLVLALRLLRHGTSFRIIDQHARPGEESRALIVHARTLEFYAQSGLAVRLIEASTTVESVKMREGGEEVGAFSLRDMGEGLSPYPFALCLPQDEHERLLVTALSERGVTIERGRQPPASRPERRWCHRRPGAWRSRRGGRLHLCRRMRRRAQPGPWEYPGGV